MNNTVEKVVNYLNTKANIKDKRVYMSLLYLNRYILKDTVIKDFGMNTTLLKDYDWLEILNKEVAFKLMDSKNIHLFLDNKYNQIEKHHSKKLVTITKEHFSNIGMYEALKDKEINIFIKLLDTLEITLDNIFEIYTRINMPDRNKNDFFTPIDLCNGIAKISAYQNIENKQVISISDITCGIGNLLYTTYKEIKSKNKDIVIEIFGNDLDRSYYSFAMSIFNLFNMKNSYFDNKNAFTEYPLFNDKKMDLAVGNPPFGDMLDSDYLHILSNNEKNLSKSQLRALKKLREVA